MKNRNIYILLALFAVFGLSSCAKQNVRVYTGKLDTSTTFYSGTENIRVLIRHDTLSYIKFKNRKGGIHEQVNGCYVMIDNSKKIRTYIPLEENNLEDHILPDSIVVFKKRTALKVLRTYYLSSNRKDSLNDYYLDLSERRARVINVCNK